MRDKYRGTGVPPTPWAFYIKLYCKRKGTTTTKHQNNLVEGMKSWLSLSQTEKQQFEHKFKECEKKYTINLFRKAEPFMKIKDIRCSDSHSQDNVNETTAQDQELQKSIEMCPSPAGSESYKEIEQSEEIHFTCGDQTMNVSKHEEHPFNEVKDLPENTSCMSEPIPLTIKSGKELFQLLNTEPGESTWATLSPADKSQYNRAVLLLKKDYLSKYRTYLESLTNKELYYCYKKTI